MIIGSANFTESEIIANLYAIALEDAGLDVETKFQIGSREAYVPALKDGSIDLIPDYTGNLLLFLDGEATATSGDDVTAALPAVLEPEGLTMLEPAPAEDKDAVVVTSETAQEWDLTTIEDLAAYNSEVKFASNAEFAERASGLPGLKALYGFEPVEFVAIADGGGPATVSALLDGQVQAANIYTTTPAIADNDFVVLEDPDANFAAQNVVPVLNSDKVTDQITEVLDAISAELTTEDLLALNGQVSGDEKLEPAEAARAWLEEKGLIG
ncbi:glycine/betaine ABC transporter substrate-binding protein [Serinibacter arcticus]|uniref:Glycine/betaine ABC transporter substrate-binding protein n=1 Tax=Serinibacter arcticus TaxID=1655435 RepID=A0A2U1ZZM3_9MICO|nr:glycine/betaine ABC transporter substrate-binding protein [Serinibacter arcticus]